MVVPGQLKQKWLSMVNGPGFDRVLNKINIISASNGNCTAEMVVGEEHVNSFGTLHGGLTSTLVDIVSGLALATHDKNPAMGVSVNLNISFLNAAALGELIVIEARTNKAGQSLAFLEVAIKCKNSGKLVATGSHTKFTA